MSADLPPKDRILAVLASSTNHQMERAPLKRAACMRYTMRYAFLDRLISELVAEGKVEIDGEMVVLVESSPPNRF